MQPSSSKLPAAKIPVKRKHAIEEEGWDGADALDGYPITAEQAGELRSEITDEALGTNRIKSIRAVVTKIKEKLSGLTPNKSAKTSAGYITTKASTTAIDACVRYWSPPLRTDALETLQATADAAAASACASVLSPLHSVQKLNLEVTELRRNVEYATIQMDQMEESRVTAMSHRSELPPRARRPANLVAAQAKMKESIKMLKVKMVALITSADSKAVSGTDPAHLQHSRGGDDDNDDEASEANPWPEDALPIDTPHLPPTIITLKHAWLRPQIPICFPQDWKPTWADAGLARFHLIDLRCRTGRPLILRASSMSAVLALFIKACLTRKKKSDRLVTPQLRNEVAAICFDGTLRAESDGRVSHWMYNFRRHVAPHFPLLPKGSVYTTKHGIPRYIYQGQKEAEEEEQRLHQQRLQRQQEHHEEEDAVQTLD